MEDENELIRRFQRGEERAFEEIVAMHRERVYGLAYRWTGNAEDALDLSQEAFLRLFRILPRWKPRAKLSTWLHRVVVNLAIDLSRRASRRRSIPLSEIREQGREAKMNVVSPGPGPRECAAGGEILERVRAAVDRLPERQRAVFVLRHYQGLSMREIAEALRCSVGCVKAHLFHALRRLRRELDPLQLGGKM